MKDKYRSWEDAISWLKQQPDKQELVRSCFYDDPIIDCAQRYHQSSEWRAVNNLLSDLEKGRALDLGAGRGISSYALAMDGWSVTSLEPDHSPIVGADAIREIVQCCNCDIEVVEAFAEELPFEDNFFDLLYGRAVMHHAKNLGEFCRQIFRVLKPGGTFLLTREHAVNNQKDLQLFFDTHPLHSLYCGEYAYPLARYKKALTVSGLSIRKTFAPYDSNINLFPRNQDELRKKIGNKLKINIPQMLFDYLIIPLLNFRDKSPGRLYSFFGCKP